MKGLKYIKAALVGGSSAIALAHPAVAASFNVPSGDLALALNSYSDQTGVQLIYSDDAVRGHRSHGAKGDYTETAALSQILRGTGFTAQAMPSNTIGIVPQPQPIEVAQVTPRRPAPSGPASVETVVVTAQKKAEDIQQVPIAITALSQQQLTERQVAGGPDLVKEVPNLTFSKTNFTGYNLEIRGIGTQAVSVTTDPAVAVAFNDTPFIRNHFFEQEFYDLQDVEVLRGPQGTLFGRNATAGVVNIKSALPDDQYQAMLSADLGNYSNRRLEGMLNVPVVGDELDIRVAGEWTKRDGYTEDQELNTNVDGRDLWSGRLSIAFNPSEKLHSTFVWEHFSEDDDRMRSAKQLCEKDPGPTSVDGLDLLTLPNPRSDTPADFGTQFARTWLSQGCLPTSLYSPTAYQTPNGQTLPFVELGEFLIADRLLNDIDPYASQTQPMNLRDIQSLILPHYRAKNDTLEFNVNYAVTPQFTLISETGYNNDFLFSTEDFNRFDTAPGIFNEGFGNSPDWHGANPLGPGGVYCDPQLGCSSSMVAEDNSQESAWQFSQEVRVASSFTGPLNFSFGTSYLRYHTVEDYYVFFNLLTAESQLFNGQGPGQYSTCMSGITPGSINTTPRLISPEPFLISDVYGQAALVSAFSCNNFGSLGGSMPNGTYIDPNPIGSLNGQGHNYFRSQNPYDLSSYAGFGEVYYDVTPTLKLTGGLRWTDDRKIFTEIPSQTFELGGGYPVAGVIKQGWNEWTGRFNAAWSPELDFTDQTMLYASYAHGYKGGGANPPGPIADLSSEQSSVTHPLTFAPEHIEAFEIGTKNAALDGTLTFNGDIFFYNYHGYQISQIVDRTSINLNFNATVEGAELESTWEPLPGLRFNFAGGWEDSAVDKNQYAIDLMDRTAGVPGWVVVRPYVAETSNCILPANVVKQILQTSDFPDLFGGGLAGACDAAYGNGHAIFNDSAQDLPAFAAAGFNPATAPNHGEGFFKNLGGNKLPNMPPFTLSTGGQYTMPVSADWVATLRADFYWQGNSFARIFNDRPYDSIHGYTNLNLALILNSQNGWDVMAYVKNVFDVTAITGAFLNSDDTALTTNVFVTDPRLFGLRVTKHLGEGEGFWGSDWSGADFIKNVFSDADGSVPPLWIEVGGQWAHQDMGSQSFLPAFVAGTPLGAPLHIDEAPRDGWDKSAKISRELGDDWTLAAGVQYGRSNSGHTSNHLAAHPSHGSYGFYDAYQDIAGLVRERHMIVDFQAGKDLGLGKFWDDQTSIVSGGVRIAQFSLRSTEQFASQPTNTNYNGTYHVFRGKFASKQSFSGIGPSISWNASENILGESSNGGIALDWGANGAVLFGRQRTHIFHQTTNNVLHHGYYKTVTHNTAALSRGKGVVVPNLGAFAGVSYRFSNAKVSLGYRADEFVGAMDRGIATRKSENVGFFGPYASISLGL